MENINITPLIEAILALIMALIARYFIPWVKERYGAQKYENYMTVVKTLVTAAEGIFKGAGRGEEKLAWVQEQLQTKGFDIDVAAIEAMVKELFNTETKEES